MSSTSVWSCEARAPRAGCQEADQHRRRAGSSRYAASSRKSPVAGTLEVLGMPSWSMGPDVVGLACDAAGFFVSGVPAVLLSTAQTSRAGESSWGCDESTTRELIEQRLDTFVACLGELHVAAQPSDRSLSSGARRCRGLGLSSCNRRDVWLSAFSLGREAPRSRKRECRTVRAMTSSGPPVEEDSSLSLIRWASWR